MQPRLKVGTVEGTGSAINVSIGFQPDYIEVYNYDDAGGLAPTIKWFSGMTAGHGLKTLKVIDSGSTGNASSAKITSGGLSQYAGSDSAGQGFTIGTDSDLNASGETLYYIAMRNS